jgi:MFS transporter, ACS family, pantothenate transporter
MGFLLKLRTIIWGAPASTEIERRLVVKLDFFVLSFCCLMYWVNYLDRANLNNAYVSGMKEDLNFQGTELNIINTGEPFQMRHTLSALMPRIVFYGGYVFGQIPNNLAIQKLPPRIYFPFAMICWGLFTLGTAFTNNPQQIMVIRFFQAVFEASTFVGVHYVLGSWYKPEELGKRTAIFTSSGLAGTLFSGFLQGGIYSSMNGRHGLAGWRWLFIVDFLITLPVAIYGFYGFPDTPSSTRARYLTAEERQLAITRLPRVEKERGQIGWSIIRRCLGTWHWYAFCLIWVFASNTEMFSTNAIMNIWLKSLRDYSVEQVNYIPTAISGVGIIATLILGWYSDHIKSRWHVGIFLSFTAIITGAVMLHPPSRGAKMFALFLNGCQYASQTVMFAWANDLCREDDAKRSIIIASMQTFSIAVYMFWSLLFYNATQGPMWTKGSIAMICMGAALLLNNVVIRSYEKRDQKRAEVVQPSFLPAHGPFELEKTSHESESQSLPV